MPDGSHSQYTPGFTKQATGQSTDAPSAPIDGDVEITWLHNYDLFTKPYSLNPDDGSLKGWPTPTMVEGQAHRIRLRDWDWYRLGDFLARCDFNQAFALGRIREDIALDCVNVTTRDRLTQTGFPDGTIARTRDYVIYAPGKPAFTLLDFDQKGMPAAVRTRLAQAGGFEAVLRSVILPGLDSYGYLMRPSTTAGIYRIDTGHKFAGSGGVHGWLLIADGADTKRFLQTLHDRCWLHGYGWHYVSAGGSLLERSLIDVSVWTPERPVFEAGAYILPDHPLAQDPAARKPVVHPGPACPTITVVPALRTMEREQVGRAKAQSREALGGEVKHVTEGLAQLLAQTTGCTVEQARRTISRRNEGVLHPDFVLVWVNPRFNDAGWTTVEWVLKYPEFFKHAELYDPIEGMAYGHPTARVEIDDNGWPWIHSFAHGRSVYRLRYDLRSAVALLEQAAAANQANAAAAVTAAYVAGVLRGDFEPGERETLRDRAKTLSGRGVRALDTAVKEAIERLEEQERKAEEARETAERTDPRPLLWAPSCDEPKLPVMKILDDVLSHSKAPEPPMRNIDGCLARVVTQQIPSMHALSSDSVNGHEGGPAKTEPAPDQAILETLSDLQAAELIERHIEYRKIIKGGAVVPTTLPGNFVLHFLKRCKEDDSTLPIVANLTTLPLVLPGGGLLATEGLNPASGTVFRILPQIVRLIPQPEACTNDAVNAAMEMLTNEFLIDVKATYSTKCVIISDLLTMVERILLSERPVYFTTAGKPGSGKTTLLIMLFLVITGSPPAAAAWPTNQEERKKAIMAYFLMGLPGIIWDNITKGTKISCQYIEQSCTAEYYSDRILGKSTILKVSSTTIHHFTGNNIGPDRELRSRSLMEPIEVDRVDPENRPFHHPDPYKWTLENRGRILQAMFTLLLANPANKPGWKGHAPVNSRFKSWWRLVGSAVENGAKIQTDRLEKPNAVTADGPTDPYKPHIVNFGDLFLKQADEDDESADLGDMLAGMALEWPPEQGAATADVASLRGQVFKAKDVAAVLAGGATKDPDLATHIKNVLMPTKPGISQSVEWSVKAVTSLLSVHINNPVRHGDQTLTLKGAVNSHTKVWEFYVLIRTHTANTQEPGGAAPA